MFFERNYPNRGIPKLSIPGIENDPKWFKSNPMFTSPLTKSDYCRLPNKEELNKKDILLEGNYFLIKLHGSYNWKSFDGSDIMVIGKGKRKQIQEEPLLVHYFEIFKYVLSQNQRRLLIIGYGFGDDHINRIISHAIKEHELKVYILSPDSPVTFKEKLYKISEKLKEQQYEEFEDPTIIWQGVSGYFQCTEVLLGSHHENPAMKRYFMTFFDGNI